jgi:small subunit ribosomal protein S16
LAVKIRLRRTGMKEQPSYRVVVTDSRMPRDGRFLENVGNFNPRTEPPTVVINAERVRYWMSVGATPSDAVARLLVKEGILASRKMEHRTKGKSKQSEETAAAPAAPAAKGA